MNPRLTILALLLVAGAILLVNLRPAPDGANAEADSPGAGTPATSGSKSTTRSRHPMRSAMEERIAGLTLEEVLAQLPAEADPLYSLKRRTATRRNDLLFRRLGALRGAQVLDDIIARYGDGPFTVDAVGSALAGWMTVDPDNASQGLIAWAQGFTDEVQSESRSRIDWNGHTVLVQGDFSFVVIQSTFHDAIRTATASDPRLGLSLLRELKATDITPPLDAYTTGLGADTNWMTVRSTLEQLVEALETDQYVLPVADAVARGWSRWDLDEAIDWYTGQHRQSDKSLEDLAHPLLVAQENPAVAMDWLESRLQSGEITDRAVARISQHLWQDATGADLRRVIALPENPATREEILARWTSPWQYRDDSQPYLAPDVLHSIIDAADLPDDAAKRHRARVDKYADLEPVYSDQ